MSVEAEFEKMAIDEFIEKFRKRLHEKADDGFTGWNYGHKGHDNDNGRLPSTASSCDLSARLDGALRKDKFIDVAAFASMLWLRQVADTKKAEKIAEKI